MHDQSDTQLNSGTDTITKENLFRLNSGTILPATLDMTSPNALANWALSDVDFRDSQNVNQRIMTRPTSHGLIIPQADQYRSWSGAATSSSMSSQGDSTARFSGSPEPQQPQMRLNPPSNSGSSTLDRYCDPNSCKLSSLPTVYVAAINHLFATLLPAAIS